MSMHSLFLHHDQEVEVFSLVDNYLMARSEFVDQAQGAPEMGRDTNLEGCLDEIDGLEEYRVCDTCEERGPHELCRNQRCQAREYLEALQGRDNDE